MISHEANSTNDHVFLLQFHWQICIYDLDDLPIDSHDMLVYRMFHRREIAFPAKEIAIQFFNYDFFISKSSDMIII